MKTIQHAKPQMNGNTREHFIEAYTALRKAQDAIEEARQTVACNVTHGRNYQHLSGVTMNKEAGILERREVDKALSSAMRTVGLLMSDISDIAA